MDYTFNLVFLLKSDTVSFILLLKLHSSVFSIPTYYIFSIESYTIALASELNGQ